MQTVYFLVCIVQLPLFVWSQSNNITAGRSVTVSISHGNQLTTEYSLDVEPASISFNSLSLSVHLTTPDIEHPSTSEYKLTPSSVTVVTTNTLDGFVSSSAREQTKNFLSYTSDKVSLTTAIASSSLIETVPEKMSSQSTISISASHFSGEVIQPTVSTVFNKEISSDHQVVSNIESKSNDIVPTSSGTSSVNIVTSSAFVESKYTTGTKSETVSASSVLMETSEPTTIANLKPSTDVLVSSSDLTSTDIKQPPSTLTETTPLHSSGVGDSLSTVNRIVSSIMDTQSALPLSRSSSIESTSHFVLQSSQMSSLTPLKSIGDSSVMNIIPTTSTSIVSMVTSDMRRSSLSQEILNSNKITSTFFEETKFSVSPLFSQQKSFSESVRYSDGQSNTVFTSSFVTQTIAGSLSPILSTSVQSPDSSMILQSIKTTVPINSKMDTSGFSDVSASLQSTFSSNTDLERSTILTTLSEQTMSAALATINLDKESFGTTRTEIMSSRTLNFVQTSGWTPSLISDLFTVKSSSQSDIAMDILSTSENLSLSTSKQDIKSTSISISDTASVMSLSVTHPSVTMAHQSSSSVSSAFYPVDSSLIPTNLTTSSLYQETSKLHLESRSVSITSDVASSNTVTTEMVQSATISPSDSMNMIYSTAMSATGSSTAFSQTIQPSSMLSSVSVEISSEIIPTPSTRDFSSSAAVVSMTSSELILQTMTSSVVVLNSTESVFLRTSIMPTSSLFISDSVNISSQLMMSSNMSAPVSQQTSQFPAFSSILPSLTSLPISDNITMIQSSVTTSAILLKTSSLNMSETEMLMSSTPVLSSRIQDLQTSSVLPVMSSAREINTTSSVPSIQSSSITTPTTTPTVPPATTTPNLADTYWVKTVIKVPLAENASATEFLIKLETRLIQAYNTAYERQQQIAAGTFTPLKKRRRRKKRLTQVGDTAIDIKESTRSSGNVSLSYTVEKAGTLVPATEVIQTLGVLSDQEMAIILQYVVASKAETHKKSYDGGTDATTSANNLWIIGVALGGIVLLIIIIWVILCVVVKKHRASEKSGGGQGEPHLIGMKSPPGEEGEGEFDGTRVNPKYIEELAERGDNSKYSVQSPKRQTYEVNTEYQEEPEYAQVKKTKKSSPSKHSTKKNQSRAPYQGHSDYENVSGTAEDTELIASPSKSKRSGKQKKSKQQDTFEDEEVAAKSYHPVSEIIPRTDGIPDTRQYSADVHDDEELKKRKEQERKKNKQRIREKKRRERKQAKKDDDYVKEYLASQQEIDTVLEAPPADGLPDVFKDKSTKSPGESKEEMSFSNEAYTGDESLQEARKKMHKLLDDAFSLISPSASMNGSSANVGNETLNEDRKHEPLYITPPAYRLGEEPGLATWSPYRAADQVALISMPKKMQTTVISNDRRGGGKRPIALFNDSGVSNQPEILTDEPPKPIILKTRQLMSNKEGQEKKGDHHRKQSYRGSISQTKPVLNRLESDSAGLTNLKSSTLVSSSNSGGEKNKNLASSIVHSRNKPSHSDNRKDSVEMTTLNGDLKSKRTNPHHAPLQVVPDGTDETDIVSRNVRSSEMPKTTIQSIRNELKSTSLSTSYRPERKASGTLADIA